MCEFDPFAHPVRHQRLTDEEVPRGTDLEIGASGDRRSRIDEIRGLEQAGAVLTLVAAGSLVAAVRAGPDDVAIREKPSVVDGVDLIRDALLDHAVGAELLCKVPRELGVLGRRASSEMVERQSKPPREVGLDRVLLGAVVLHAEPRLGGCELCRRAVFIGRADEEHLVPAEALVACVDVRREHRPDERAEVFDAVDVRQGTRDQMATHRRIVQGHRRRPPSQGVAVVNRVLGNGAFAAIVG